jgi:outer membrane biogenesis lipoprotein LolB
MIRWTALTVFVISLFLTGCGSSTPEPTKVSNEAVQKRGSKNLPKEEQ